MLEVVEKMILEEIEERNMPISWEPCLVQAQHGHKVSDVACGLDHSIVICLIEGLGASICKNVGASSIQGRAYQADGLDLLTMTPAVRTAAPRHLHPSVLFLMLFLSHDGP